MTLAGPAGYLAQSKTSSEQNVNYTLFYKNILYKNIEAEICEILEYFKNKPEAEILKRI